MDVPESYKAIRSEMEFDEVPFGVGGIELYPLARLQQMQEGYSTGPDGTSLCDGSDGAWRSNWLVIGHETACGDPIFMDVVDPVLPVFTSIHGEGQWEPVKIAISLVSFVDALRQVRAVAVGRENPAALEANPLPAPDLQAVVRRIDDLNGSGVDMSFWAILLDAEPGIR